MTEQADRVTIIREEHGYNGWRWLGVMASGLLVTANNLADLPMTQDTRIFQNPKVEGAATAPVKVYEDPSLICGLDCPFCLSNAPHFRENGHKIPYLKLDEVQTVNKQVIDAGVLQVKIGGGEPFTYPGTWPTIVQLGEAGIALSTSTSGITLAHERLLNREQIGILARYRVKISLSVDGEPDYHDGIRGRNGLLREALNEGVTRLIEGGVPPKKIEFRSTISNNQDSIAQLEYLDRLARDTNTKLRIRIARPYGRAEDNDTAVIYPTEQNTDLLRKIRAMAAVNPLLNIDSFLRFDQGADVHTGLDCGAGTRSAFIDASANFSPCGAIAGTFPENHTLLNGGNLLEAWQKGAAFTKVREFFRLENANSPCAGCAFKDACQGGCPSVRLAAGVNKNPLCPVDILKPTLY